MSYQWDFGDGNSGTGMSVTHTYTSPGIYIATLTVTDDAGAECPDSVKITANAPDSLLAPSDLDGYVSSGTVDLFWLDNSDNEDGFSSNAAPIHNTFMSRLQSWEESRTRRALAGENTGIAFVPST